MITPTPVSAATQAPPELVSEHGRGMVVVPKKTVTVKAHTRQVADKSKAKSPPVVDPITAQINAAQLPQLQAIQAAQAASTLAAKNASTTTAGYYSALGDLLKGAAPQAQSTYQSAAGDTAAFGKGFSTGLSHVQSQIDNEGANAAGISGGTAPAAGGPAASDALYALGGYIPASTMEREGAAATAAAAGLPGAALGQGAGALAKIQADNQLAQKDFGTKLTDLAAQVPGLRLQYKAQADALKAKADAVAQHEKDVKIQQQLAYIAATGTDPTTGKLTPKAQAEWARVSGYMPDGTPTASTRAATTRANQEQARVDLAFKNYNLAVDRYNAKQSSDAKKASNPDAALSGKAGYFVDASGNPLLNANGTIHLLPGYAIKSGRVVKIGAAKTPAPLTTKEIQNYKGQAARIAAGAFTGLPEVLNSNGTVKLAKQDPIDWGAALKEELQAGVPINLAIAALLGEYTQQGVRGRPWNQPAVVNPSRGDKNPRGKK